MGTLTHDRRMVILKAEKTRAGSRAPIEGRCGSRLHTPKRSDGTPDRTAPIHYCVNRPCAGRMRCRMHGGTQPVGIAAPGYKTGKYSRYALLPEGVANRFRKTTEDADWLSMHAEISLVLARMERAAEHGKWPKWDALSSQLRMLMDSEMKRREQAQTMLSVDRVLVIVDKLVDAVHKHVTDRAIFAAIYQEIQVTLSARPLVTPRSRTQPPVGGVEDMSACLNA